MGYARERDGKSRDDGIGETLLGEQWYNLAAGMIGYRAKQDAT